MLSQNKDVIKNKNRIDIISKFFIFLLSLSSIVLLVVMFVMILREAVPSYKEYGFFHMYFSADFSEAGKFGIWGALSITLVTSILAVIIALPISLRTAIFLKYRIKKGRKPIQILINVLAGVPSIIFGIFALKSLSGVSSFLGFHSSNTIFNAVLTLIIMIFPTLVSMIYNQLDLVPQDLLNSSLALGNTKTHSIYKVIKKSIHSGVIVSVIVALGRAIGETMALSIILTTGPLENPFGQGLSSFFDASSGTLGVMIARLIIAYRESDNPNLSSALFAAGIALFLIVMILVISANRISKRKLMGNENPFLFRKQVVRDKFPATTFYYIALGFYFLTLPFKIMRYYIFMLLERITIGIKYASYYIAYPINYFIYPRKYKNNQDLYLQASKHWGRKAIDYMRVFLEMISFAIIIGSILWICIDIFAIGIPEWNRDAWSWSYSTTNVFKQEIVRPGIILNTMVFTLLLVLMTIAVCLPFALMGALYLSEYANHKKSGKIIRFFLDSLGGTPSILFGIFGVIMFRQQLGLGYRGGFSFMAGVLTMVIVVLPTFTRSIEQVLVKIPYELREASYSLGATKFETIRKIVLPQALPGMVTGIILAAGRIVSETAPIYLTIGMLGNTMVDLDGEAWTMTTKILYNQIYATDNAAVLLKQSYSIAAAAILLVVFIILLAEFINPLMKRRPIKKLFTGQYFKNMKGLWRKREVKYNG